MIRSADEFFGQSPSPCPISCTRACREGFGVYMRFSSWHYCYVMSLHALDLVNIKVLNAGAWSRSSERVPVSLQSEVWCPPLLSSPLLSSPSSPLLSSPSPPLLPLPLPSSPLLSSPSPPLLSSPSPPLLSSPSPPPPSPSSSPPPPSPPPPSSPPPSSSSSPSSSPPPLLPSPPHHLQNQFPFSWRTMWVMWRTSIKGSTMDGSCIGTTLCPMEWWVLTVCSCSLVAYYCPSVRLSFKMLLASMNWR